MVSFIQSLSLGGSNADFGNALLTGDSISQYFELIKHNFSQE